MFHIFRGSARDDHDAASSLDRVLLRRRPVLVWGAMVAAVIGGSAVVAQTAGVFATPASGEVLQVAQADDAADAPADKAKSAAKKKKVTEAKSRKEKADAAGETQAQAQAPAPPKPQETAQPAANPEILTKQLQAEGVRACIPRLETIGRGSLQGVAQFNTMSAWQKAAADQRPVSMIIGMKYPQGSDVTSGMAGFFGSPKGGDCDVSAIQIMPSTKSCQDLQQEVLKANGRVIGDLAGIGLLENRTGSQVALLPTAGNGCVIVRQQMAYAP